MNSNLGNHNFRKLKYASTAGRKITNTIPKRAKKMKLPYFPVSGTIPVYTCGPSVPTCLTFPSDFKFFNEELLIGALVDFCFGFILFLFCFYIFYYLDFTTTLWGKCCPYSHFADDRIEAQSHRTTKWEIRARCLIPVCLSEATTIYWHHRKFGEKFHQ